MKRTTYQGLVPDYYVTAVCRCGATFIRRTTKHVRCKVCQESYRRAYTSLRKRIANAKTEEDRAALRAQLDAYKLDPPRLTPNDR